jgi:hypothetical protein
MFRGLRITFLREGNLKYFSKKVKDPARKKNFSQ